MYLFILILYLPIERNQMWVKSHDIWMEFPNQSNQKGAAYLHNLQQGSSLGPTINT